LWPIFKGGASNLFTNYRPISFLPCFSIFFEKAAYTRLESYITANNIWCKNQYGFRPKFSNYMALLEMHNKITDSIDKKRYTVGIFIDLSKAFDSLDHSILLAKLEHYGIRGVSLCWFRNYLFNRKQYVCVDNCSSTVSDVDCDIPQGSILGPLLFILYINDVINCSHYIIRFHSVC